MICFHFEHTNLFSLLLKSTLTISPLFYDSHKIRQTSDIFPFNGIAFDNISGMKHRKRRKTDGWNDMECFGFQGTWIFLVPNRVAVHWFLFTYIQSESSEMSTLWLIFLFTVVSYNIVCRPSP